MYTSIYCLLKIVMYFVFIHFYSLKIIILRKFLKVLLENYKIYCSNSSSIKLNEKENSNEPKQLCQNVFNFYFSKIAFKHLRIQNIFN